MCAPVPAYARADSCCNDRNPCFLDPSCRLCILSEFHFCFAFIKDKLTSGMWTLASCSCGKSRRAMPANNSWQAGGDGAMDTSKHLQHGRLVCAMPVMARSCSVLFCYLLEPQPKSPKLYEKRAPPPPPQTSCMLRGVAGALRGSGHLAGEKERMVLLRGLEGQGIANTAREISPESRDVRSGIAALEVWQTRCSGS